MRNISASLQEDVHREAVKAHAEGRDVLTLEEWMVGGYLASSRVRKTRERLGEEPCSMTGQEKLEARDCLVVQLLLTNTKRAGDITHIKASSIRELRVKEGEELAEFYVSLYDPMSF